MWASLLWTFTICQAVYVHSQTTVTGERCVSMYKYNGKTYVGCTKDYIGISWCGLKAEVPNSLSPGSWGFCVGPDSGGLACSVTTTGGTAPNGTRCILPFNYRGGTYSTCTGSDSRGAWCPIDPDFNGRWGYCVYSATIPTVRGNSNGAPCHFPFEYQGFNYTFCSTADNNYIPWCATTDNYSRDQLWGACDFPSCN